jgi:glutamate 5-kinase
MTGNDELALRKLLKERRRWVVKIGSSLLTADGRGVDRAGIGGWCADIATLASNGAEVVLVSSGAVAEGCARLGLTRRPESVHELQAAAAVGQMGLIEAYESAFQRHGRRTALVLLTHEDLASRQRYLNARATLRTLLSLGVVPVVNENDTVATEEIKFGDNDTLASLVTNLIEADVLVLLTDRDGLHEADPGTAPNAPVVTFARAGDVRLDGMVGNAGRLGRGGMATKVGAARVAARSGATTVIANGRLPQALTRIRDGEPIGTLLTSDVEPLVARKRWIAGQLRTKGELLLDAGAVRVLRNEGRSLLPVGVKATTGDYARGDVVLCVGPDGGAVAKGLVNYSSDETRRIVGCSSSEIAARLGYVDEPELVHRDNLVLL